MGPERHRQKPDYQLFQTIEYYGRTSNKYPAARRRTASRCTATTAGTSVSQGLSQVLMDATGVLLVDDVVPNVWRDERHDGKD